MVKIIYSESQRAANFFVGSISSVTVLGQTIVVLNDSRHAYELMEKRSALHSSRPRMVFGGEM